MIQLIHHWLNEEVDKTASLRAVFEDHYANYASNDSVWKHMLDLEQSGNKIYFNKGSSYQLDSQKYTASIYETQAEKEQALYSAKIKE